MPETSDSLMRDALVIPHIDAIIAIFLNEYHFRIANHSGR